MTAGKDRWIGAILYFPTDSSLWVSGPSGATKPSAGRTLGLLIWVGLGFLVAAIVVLTGWGLLRLTGLL